MAEKHRRYALCIQVEPDEDLQLRKIYEVLPDVLAESHGHLRIVDESGEDYLYPAGSFVLLDLPKEAERALRPRSKRTIRRHTGPRMQRTGSTGR